MSGRRRSRRLIAVHDVGPRDPVLETAPTVAEEDAEESQPQGEETQG